LQKGGGADRVAVVSRQRPPLFYPEPATHLLGKAWEGEVLVRKNFL